MVLPDGYVPVAIPSHGSAVRVRCARMMLCYANDVMMLCYAE
jgi:hypothetical protein